MRRHVMQECLYFTRIGMNPSNIDIYESKIQSRILSSMFSFQRCHCFTIKKENKIYKQTNRPSQNKISLVQVSGYYTKSIQYVEMDFLIHIELKN